MTKIIKTIILIILIATGQIAFGQSAFNYRNDFKNILAKTKDKSDNLSYEKLLKRFTVNDTTLTDYDVLALLIGYTDKAEYKPYSDITTERQIYNLNGDEKYKEGLELGLKFIKTHPLNVKTLFEISYSYHKLNQKDSAKIYSNQGFRIFEAMYFSGNGKTKETPTFALGPADGQDYIYKFVNADIGTMGSGRDKNGDFLDILEAKFKDGHTLNLFFIIQHATDKMFSSEDMEKMEKEINTLEKEEN